MNKFSYTDEFYDNESSVVSAVYYNEKTYELFVNTVRDDNYGYQSVPKYVFDNFKNSTSRGQFWNFNVKPKYRAMVGHNVTAFTPVNAPAPSLAQAFKAEPAKDDDEYTVTCSVSGTLRVVGTADGILDAINKASKILHESLEGDFTVEKVEKNK